MFNRFYCPFCEAKLISIPLRCPFCKRELPQKWVRVLSALESLHDKLMELYQSDSMDDESFTILSTIIGERTSFAVKTVKSIQAQEEKPVEIESTSKEEPEEIKQEVIEVQQKAVIEPLHAGEEEAAFEKIEIMTEPHLEQKKEEVLQFKAQIPGKEEVIEIEPQIPKNVEPPLSFREPEKISEVTEISRPSIPSPVIETIRPSISSPVEEVKYARIDSEPYEAPSVPGGSFLDFRNWITQPIVYENILWFLSSFLILSGVVYFVTTAWVQMSSRERLYVLSGSLMGISFFFYFTGRFFLKRFQLNQPGLVLYTISLLLVPFAFVPLGDLEKESHVLMLLGCFLVVALFAPLISSVGRYYNDSLRTLMPSFFLPLSLLQALIPWIVKLDWAYNVLIVYMAAIWAFIAILTVMVKKIPALATVLYGGLIEISLLTFLGSWHLQRIEASGQYISISLYGPLALILAWTLAILRPRIQIPSVEDSPTHPLTAFAFLFMVLGIVLSTGDKDPRKMFMLVTLWASLFLSARWAREYRRAYFVGIVLGIGVFAYFLLGGPIRETLIVIREQIKSGLGYQKGEKLPFSYYGITFLPYLAVVSIYAHHFLKKAKESFFRVTWIWLLIFSCSLIIFANLLHRGDYRAPLATLPVYAAGYFYLAYLLRLPAFLYLGSISSALAILNAGLMYKLDWIGIIYLITAIGLLWWFLTICLSRKSNTLQPLKKALFDTSLLAASASFVATLFIAQNTISLSSYSSIGAISLMGVLWAFLTVTFRVELFSVVFFICFTGSVALLPILIWPYKPEMLPLFIAIWSLTLSIAKSLIKGSIQTLDHVFSKLARPGREGVTTFGTSGNAALFNAYILGAAGLAYTFGLYIPVTKGYYNNWLMLCFMILALGAAIPALNSKWRFLFILYVATGIGLELMAPKIALHGLAYSLVILAGGIASGLWPLLTTGLVAFTFSAFTSAYGYNATIIGYVGILEALAVFGLAGTYLMPKLKKDILCTRAFYLYSVLLLIAGFFVLLWHHTSEKGGNTATLLGLVGHAMILLTLHGIKQNMLVEILFLISLWCTLSQFSWIVFEHRLDLLAFTSFIYASGLMLAMRLKTLARGFRCLKVFSVLGAFCAYTGSSIMVFSPEYVFSYPVILGLVIYTLYLAFCEKQELPGYIFVFLAHQSILLALWYFSSCARFWYDGLPVLLQAVYAVLLCFISSTIKKGGEYAYLSRPLSQYGYLLAGVTLILMISEKILNIERTLFSINTVYAAAGAVLVGPLIFGIHRRFREAKYTEVSDTGDILLTLYIILTLVISGIGMTLKNTEMGFYGVGHSVLIFIAGLLSGSWRVVGIGTASVTLAAFFSAYSCGTGVSGYLWILEALSAIWLTGAFLFKKLHKEDYYKILSWAGQILLVCGIFVPLWHHLEYKGGNFETLAGITTHTFLLLCLYILKQELFLKVLILLGMWCVLNQASWLTFPGRHGAMAMSTLLYSFGLDTARKIKALASWASVLSVFFKIMAIITYASASLMIFNPVYDLSYPVLIGLVLYMFYMAIYEKQEIYVYIFILLVHQCILAGPWYFSKCTAFWYDGLPLLLQGIYASSLCLAAFIIMRGQIAGYFPKPLYMYGSTLATLLTAFLVFFRIINAADESIPLFNPVYGVLVTIIIGILFFGLHPKESWGFGLYPSLASGALFLVYILDYFSASEASYALVLATLCTGYTFLACCSSKEKRPPFIHTVYAIGIVAFMLCFRTYMSIAASLTIGTALLLFMAFFMLALTAFIFSLFTRPDIHVVLCFILLFLSYYFCGIRGVLIVPIEYQPLSVLTFLAVLLVSAVSLKDKEIQRSFKDETYRFPAKEWLNITSYTTRIIVWIMIFFGFTLLPKLFSTPIGHIPLFYRSTATRITTLGLVGLAFLISKYRLGKEALVLALILAMCLFSPLQNMIENHDLRATVLPDMEIAVMALGIALLRWRGKTMLHHAWPVLLGIIGILMTNFDIYSKGTSISILAGSATALILAIDTKKKIYLWASVFLTSGTFYTFVSYIFPYEGTHLSPNYPITCVLTALLSTLFFFLAGHVKESKLLQTTFWENIENDFYSVSTVLNVLSLLFIAPTILDILQAGKRVEHAIGWIYILLFVITGFNLILHGLRSKKSVFIYGMQILLLIGYLFARHCTYYLDTLSKNFDPYMMVIFGISFFHASLAVKPYGPDYVQNAFRLGGLLYPVASFFMVSYDVSLINAGVASLMAVHYGIIAMVDRNRWLALVSALMGNGALWIYWSLWGVLDLQFYGIPLGLTVIAFVELNRKDFSPAHLQFWRFIGLLIIYASVGVQIIRIDDPKYAFILGAWAMIGIFVGIKIGNPLYWATSTVALVMDVIGHLIATYGFRHHFSTAALLLLVGLCVLALNIYIHAKRKREEK